MLMKPLLAICGIFLALCTAPAFADTLEFSNHGLEAVSGTGGVTALTVVSDLNLDGMPIITGPAGMMIFTTGTFVGSLQTGGTFSAGSIAIQFDAIAGTIFASDFSGTWSKLGDDLFKLVGTFSGTLDNVGFQGMTSQTFDLGFENGQPSFRDLNGVTTVTPVPEPGTLALIGTGLLSLGGAIRRKFQVAFK
jgi:PEP-CTERM motif